jgi:hypothetical protein
MTLKKPDLREYERQEGEKVPGNLKDFSIDFGWGEQKAATISNFSPQGIRLHVQGEKIEVSPREVILLHPAGEPITLAGDIIHIIPDGTGGYYLGILLLGTKSLARYRQLIQ